MRQIWTGRAAQAAAKYGEVAPMSTVCCNACRTCVQTNLIGLAVAAGSGLALAVARFAKRTAKASSFETEGKAGRAARHPSLG